LYLDHNATTPLLPEAREAMLPYLGNEFGNPSSAHSLGRRARDAVERARGQVARFLGCAPWEVVFTSGGTEANNLAIRGVVAAAKTGRRRIVTSTVEHAAVQAPCERLEREGLELCRVGVDATGTVLETPWASMVNEQTLLCTVMHANNEVGAVQPIAQLARHAHGVGALMHTDAAQSAGKLPVNVAELGVDLLTLAAHKFYGPKGVGVLYVRTGTPVASLVAGAGHERGLRAGTENVPGIVGMGVAAEHVGKQLVEEAARVAVLRKRLLGGLMERIPGLALHGSVDGGLCNTLNVSFPGVSGSAVLRHAPDICASTGSACHGEEESSVLSAMGVPPESARGAVRLSLGRLTGPEEIERAVACLSKAYLQARRG
jgi:cysteine desulfurase